MYFIIIKLIIKYKGLLCIHMQYISTYIIEYISISIFIPSGLRCPFVLL